MIEIKSDGGSTKTTVLIDGKNAAELGLHVTRLELKAGELWKLEAWVDPDKIRAHVKTEGVTLILDIQSLKNMFDAEEVRLQ